MPLPFTFTIHLHPYPYPSPQLYTLTHTHTVYPYPLPAPFYLYPSRLPFTPTPNQPQIRRKTWPGIARKTAIAWKHPVRQKSCQTPLIDSRFSWVPAVWIWAPDRGIWALWGWTCAHWHEPENIINDHFIWFVIKVWQIKLWFLHKRWILNKLNKTSTNRKAMFDLTLVYWHNFFRRKF